MANICETKSAHNRKPHAPLLCQAQDDTLINSEQRVQTPDVCQQHLSQRSYGCVICGECSEGRGAFDIPLRIHECEVGSSQRCQRLEVEEVYCVE